MSAAMILTAFFAVGCKKEAPAPKEAPALPAQPPLEPVQDDFQEPDSTAAAVKTPPRPQPVQVANGAYTLQIQLFREKAAAVSLAEKLKAQGIPAYVASIVDPKPELSGTYYRVRAGSFATTAAAREYGKINLTPIGRDFWVDLKARDSKPVHEVYAPRPAVAPPAPAAPAPVAAPAKPVPAPETPPAVSAPAPAPSAAPAAPKAEPLDPALVPRNLEGQPAVKDTGHVEDW